MSEKPNMLFYLYLQVTMNDVFIYLYILKIIDTHDMLS
jgi:hypothetical protein